MAKTPELQATLSRMCTEGITDAEMWAHVDQYEIAKKILKIIAEVAGKPYFPNSKKVVLAHEIAELIQTRYLVDLQAAKDKIERLNRVTLRDWPEDLADDDNGDYLHKCDTCADDFFGHKRRAAICKQCWIEFATKIVVEHNQRKAADDVRDTEAGRM